MKRILLALAMLWPILNHFTPAAQAQIPNRSGAVNGTKKDSINLDRDTLHIEEVYINTGYQRIPKERATGSFVFIDSALLNRRISTHILDRLDGVTSGLIFNRNNQGSGNETPISIRGRSTLFANPEPLIILDDFPYEGDLGSINPNDIENITVLKDAAAASIWGVRAGNGVIVISTKSGKIEHSPSISVRANITASPKPDLYYTPQLSSSEFIEVEQFLFEKGKYNAAINNGYGALSPAVELLLKARNGEIDEAKMTEALLMLSRYDIRQDQERYLYRNSLNQQYQLEIAGGGKANTYFISGGADRNLTAPISESYDRYALNARNSYRLVNGKLKLSSGLLFANTKSTANQRPYRPDNPYDRIADAMGNALPVSDGTLRLSYLDNLDESLGLLDWYYRPLEEEKANFEQVGTSIRATNSLDFSVLPSLILSAQHLYHRGNTNIIRNNPLNSYYTRNQINTFTQVNATNRTLSYPIPLGDILASSVEQQVGQTGRLLAKYHNRTDRGNELSGIMGAEISGRETKAANSTLYGFDEAMATNQNGTIDFTKNYTQFYRSNTARINAGIGNSGSIDRYISYFGNLSYSIHDRYVFSGSFRKDESNLFGVKSNQRGVPLWSAGILYKISKEDFYPFAWLPVLSLRMTYGYNGNIDKRTTAYLTARSVGISPVWNSPYSTVTNPPNPALTWERVRNINMEVDFATANSRISGSIAYYLKEGLDLIGDSPIAPQTGVSSFRGNSASTRTKGMDLVLNSHNLEKDRTVAWTTNFLFNYVKDEVVAYQRQAGSNWDVISGNYNAPLIGYPYHSVFSFPWAGLDTEGNPQLQRDGEVSKDYAAARNATDRSELVYSGSGSPTVFGAIRNSIDWKNFSLSVNLTYKMGYFFRRRSLDNSALYNNYNYQQADYSHRWQQPGDETHTDVPALIYPANLSRTTAYTYSNILVERGNHFRIQDVAMSYQIRGDMLRNAVVKDVKLHAYVNNIGMIWRANDRGIDPDHHFSPAIRTYSIGCNLTF